MATDAPSREELDDVGDPADPLEAFKAAVRGGDAGRVRRLLARHAGVREVVNAPLFAFGSRPLMEAREDRAVVDALLEFGADPNLRSDWWAGGFGVLDGASAGAAEYLIARGARVDVHAAAGHGMVDRLRALLDADPSLVRAKGGDGQRPLHFASTPEAVDLLLERGAEVDARCVDHGSTAAQWAVPPAGGRRDSFQTDGRKCRHLLARGAAPDVFMACALGDAELAERCLREDPGALEARVGVPPFTSPGSEGGHIYAYLLGSTARPLSLAARLGHWALVDFFLPRATPRERFLYACSAADGAAVDAALAADPGLVASLPPEDLRLLSDAAWDRNAPAVEVMLRAGFPVDARGAHGSTALNRAVVRGYADVADLLLRRGASLELRNEFGGTPLDACVWGSEHFRDQAGDYPACVERLLAAGAPVPAEAEGTEAVREVLRRHGAK